MLYPQTNPFRQQLDLSGFWDFRFDPEVAGEQSGWMNGFYDGRPLAVPASWNDQLVDERDNLGPGWYQLRFDLPWGWQDQRIRLRFGSVNYLADVWINGELAGRHEGGHLPFEFDISDRVRGEDNLLVVRVDGGLAPDRVPPGNVPRDPTNTFAVTSYPATNFDFFPFCGIHRPVVLSATPWEAIEDLTINTTIEGSAGLVRVRPTISADALARCTLHGHGASVAAEIPLAGPAEAVLKVPQASFWGPGSPALYLLTVELVNAGKVFDRYTLPVGIRTVSVEGDALLLNGKPVKLTGFGRHEDFPVAGRGLMPAVVVKDYELLRWVGANSFRTSHYPYSDEMMALADRLGFLVIDETPAVGLFFAEPGLARRLELCRQFIRELIARDKNHPSVIMWSLANEPHSYGEVPRDFFKNLFDLATSLDDTRPMTLVSHLGVLEESFEFLDVVCLNRYYGWYSESGQLAEGFARLAAELDSLHDEFPKPLLLTEFGADAIPGWHAQPAEMFSEEFQAELISGYVEICNARPFVVGEHVWNLCDFKTSQAVHRMGALNYKGVFTRDRRPKLAAHRLRTLWGGDQTAG